MFDQNDVPFALYTSTILGNLAAGETRNVTTLLENANVKPQLKTADIHRYEATAHKYKMFHL